MDKELFDFIAERAGILATADSAKQETKDAAAAWQEAVAAEGADVEAATTKFVNFLEGRPTTIDGLIGFLQNAGAQVFGEDAAKQALEGALAHKAQGGKYCTCPACTAASQILGKAGRIEL